MRVILYDYILLVCLDASRYLSQSLWSADASHILETDFVCPGVDELLCEIDVEIYGMYRRMSDTERSLRNHSALLGILYGRNDVAGVVESAEDTGDVSALDMLHLIEEAAQVLWAWAHTEGIESTVEHVGLYACFVKRLRPLTHCDVRVFSIEEVYLLETATIGFYSVKTSHLDDGWRYPEELIHAWLVLACTLPHIPEDQTEFYLFWHIFVIYFVSLLSRCAKLFL